MDDLFQACADLGAYLVKIDSLEENNNVAAFVASQDGTNSKLYSSIFVIFN